MENESTPVQSEQKTVHYAGFWWRFLAYLIDQIVISFAAGIFIVPIVGIFGLSIYSLAESGQNLEQSPVFWGSVISFYIVIFTISLLINWLYFAIMESSRHQGTLGKLLLRIKVTDYSYQRVSFGRATGRLFGKYVSSFILLIGYIMAGFTAKKQALHDIIASCYVIREEREFTVNTNRQ